MEGGWGRRARTTHLDEASNLNCTDVVDLFGQHCDTHLRHVRRVLSEVVSVGCLVYDFIHLDRCITTSCQVHHADVLIVVWSDDARKLVKG